MEDFVSPEEEAQLLAAVDWLSADDDVTGYICKLFLFSSHILFLSAISIALTSVWCLLAQKALKHRRVRHYGYEFRYDNNNVDKDKPLAAGKTVTVFSTIPPV